MSIVRSERAAAVLLLAAAALGLIAANSPLADVLGHLKHAELAVPGAPIVLSVSHWISDGLLAIFFFVAAIELRHELTAGELNSPTRAMRPAIAAIGGIVVPVAIYLAIAGGSGYEHGWPIPTATDIAFALGVLAVFGKGMPGKLRIFLLALAILDDIVAILIIAVFFTVSPDLLMLLFAAIGVAIFAVLGRFLGGPARIPVIILMVLVGLVVWSLVLLSGVHATIAGVALGLVLRNKPGHQARHLLEPAVNGGILPIFAFSAAFVTIPTVPLSDLVPPFWGILIALPLGKLIGITLGGWLGGFIGPKTSRVKIRLEFLLAAGALGGIGFTVSLLMNELAFDRDPTVSAEGTLAVLAGSMISLILAAILVSRQAAYHRRLRRIRDSVHAARIGRDH